MKRLTSLIAVALLGLPLVCFAQAPEGDNGPAMDRPAAQRPQRPNRERGPRDQQRRPGREGDFRGPMGPAPRITFEMFDANKDGVIDKTEFENAKNAFLPPMPPREGFGDRGPRDRGPQDGDRPNMRRGQRDGDRGPREGFRPDPMAFFNHLDKNQDGTITADELPAENEHLQKMFQNMDANKDGKIEKSEWKLPPMPPRDGMRPNGRPGDRPQGQPGDFPPPPEGNQPGPAPEGEGVAPVNE